MRASSLAATVIAAGIGLTGCGANHSSIYRSYQITPGSSNSVLIDAKQRAILSTNRTVNPAANLGGDPTGNPRTATATATCAEPSPDALSAISTSLSASGSGVFGGGQSVQAALASALAETATQLGVRNATITLLRDGLYRQCEAFMNGLISPDEYRITTQKYVNAMVTLLAIEQIAPVGATAQTIRAAEGSTVSANTHISVNVPGENDTADAEDAAAANSAEDTAEEADPQDGASGSAAEENNAGEGVAAADQPSEARSQRAASVATPPVVSVNVSAAPTQYVPSHVSKAVTQIVTSFFQKDTRDYCLSAIMQPPVQAAAASNQVPWGVYEEFIRLCAAVFQAEAAALQASTAGAFTDRPDECSEALRRFWGLDPEKLSIIQAAMTEVGVSEPVTVLINAQELSAERRAVGSRLNLAACKEG